MIKLFTYIFIQIKPFNIYIELARAETAGYQKCLNYFYYFCIGKLVSS